ncbi:MAG: hypothetical protein WED34_18315 [Planctomycetales bacterium]
MTKFQKAYYSAHSLRDGTIWFAVQTRKPRKSRHFTPKIDEDGIHRWFIDEDEPQGISDWGKAVRHGAVANHLNAKRLVRQQVEPKLNELLRLIGELGERLAKIEHRLGITE